MNASSLQLGLHHISSSSPPLSFIFTRGYIQLSPEPYPHYLECKSLREYNRVIHETSYNIKS
jgi:hypothetical protein